MKIIFFSVGFIALFGTFLLGIKWKAMKTEDNDSQNDMRDKHVNSVIPNSLENYFAYSGEKGFTIFVWEISKDNYRCGIMEGTNRFTMDNEDLLDMGFRQGISVEEMREVLAFYNLPDDMIVVEPFYPIQSSYASEHDYLSPEYRAFLRELIIGK